MLIVLVEAHGISFFITSHFNFHNTAMFPTDAPLFIRNEIVVYVSVNYCFHSNGVSMKWVRLTNFINARPIWIRHLLLD